MEERIRERAYFLWEAAGRPAGRDGEFWDRAQKEVVAESKADGTMKKASKPKAAAKKAAPKKAPTKKAAPRKVAEAKSAKAEATTKKKSPAKKKTPAAKAKTKAKVKPKPEPAPKPAAKEKPSTSAKAKPKAKPAAKPTTKKADAPPPPRREGSPRNVSECSWIEGTPRKGVWDTCGRPTLPGKPYCEEHFARAYNKPRDK